MGVKRIQAGVRGAIPPLAEAPHQSGTKLVGVCLVSLPGL
jgi:hypothetical protein